jgi:hypothetical protein
MDSLDGEPAGAPPPAAAPAAQERDLHTCVLHITGLAGDLLQAQRKAWHTEALRVRKSVNGCVRFDVLTVRELGAAALVVLQAFISKQCFDAYQSGEANQQRLAALSAAGADVSTYHGAQVPDCFTFSARCKPRMLDADEAVQYAREFGTAALIKNVTAPGEPGETKRTSAMHMGKDEMDRVAVVVIVEVSASHRPSPRLAPLARDRVIGTPARVLMAGKSRALAPWSRRVCASEGAVRTGQGGAPRGRIARADDAGGGRLMQRAGMLAVRRAARPEQPQGLPLLRSVRVGGGLCASQGAATHGALAHL